ncbi:MAG: aldolase [Alphaproteobacteria bacterium]|nr:aldolase [Alphaproteobacteria bacterium]
MTMRNDALQEARVDLAAICRWAYRLGFQSGVGNHFSLMVPGSDDRFLVTPEGLYWSEVTASNLVICDFDGKVIEGEHGVDTTAFYLHAPVHKANPAAKCVLHTHMPNTTALCMIKGARLEPAHQSALGYVGRTAYDEHYAGLALTWEEGARVAGLLGNDNHTILLRNHGPLVVGPTAAEAFVRLEFLEETCKWQLMAMHTGRELQHVEPKVHADVMRRVDEGGGAYAAVQIAAMKRVLDKQEPDFRH